MHSGKNKNYVESFGDPSSSARIFRIDEIIAGLNEFSGGGPEAVSKRKSDIAVLFSWNHKKEILKKEKNFSKNGGKWISHVKI